jgi:hypothetical protein
MLLVLPHPRAVFRDEEGPLVTQVSMATEEAVHVLTCHLAVHDEAVFQFHGARRPRVALAHTDAAETILLLHYGRAQEENGFRGA